MMTASTSFWSRQVRQSQYVLALGKIASASLVRWSFTSHSATTFSLSEDVVVRGAAAPYADEGDIQLVAGGVLPAQRAALQNDQSGARGGSGFQ